MTDDLTDDGRVPAEESPLAEQRVDHDPIVDEYGVVQSIGPISVGELIYRATDELAAGPAGPALARMTQDAPTPAEGELLTLRYIAASRARDEVAMADIALLLGERSLSGNLVKLLTAAWLELGYEPDQILTSLTGYALTDICESAADN